MNDNYPFEFNEKAIGKPKYKGFNTSSHYIKMRDGVKIAADVYLPKNLLTNERVPAVLIQTRYWRALRFRLPFKWLIQEPEDPKIVKILTSYGFAVVGIDVRGTGASHGTRSLPFTEDEVKDGADIVNWIISQPWSDGNVVTCGNSYKGTTSELAVSLAHPAIKCALIKHNPWDLYLHAAFPGGVFNQQFIQLWSNLGRALDQTRGKALLEMKPYNRIFAILASRIVKSVKPVDSDKEEDKLENIARIHEANKHPYDYFGKVDFRDDPLDEGVTIDSISIFSKKEQIEKLNIPLYTWGSWMDSTTADATIHRFLNFRNPQKAVIGDWDHKALHRANPYFHHKKSVEPSKENQIRDWAKFYRDCLKNEFGSKKILYYYTMGEEKWKETSTWPPPNQTISTWYLNENNKLLKNKPENESGSDKHVVNYNSTTGKRNRWYTLLSLPINHAKREEEDKKLLIYNSEPLEQELEITGYPIITLFLKTTHEDGMVQVHFEFIDENEKIHWMTDGQLRFMHRKISEEIPPYKLVIPYHSFKSKDALPVIPKEIMEIKFALNPISILLRKGSRMRLAIGGADKDTFARYPETGIPTITIERNSIHSSNVNLPIIKKDT
ncbi:MAG: CocE/NonD family hydrolase [Candidatus Helarchaeota archaeon]